jgi:putative DNA primase/helicase
LFHSKGFVTVTGDFVVGGDIPALPDSLRDKLEALATAKAAPQPPKRLAPPAGRGDAKAPTDPRLQAIKAAGLYERDMGKGKHSICCPLEHLHSDLGRPPGDGDTTYFQPNTNGYEEGWIHCLHTHTNDQAVYWDKLGYNPAGEAMRKLLAGDGWPEPQPIPDDLPPVPTFDLGLLPKSLRLWIADIAERMQISPDIPAIGAVTALSAAIGRRVQIMPKAQDDWTVVPNLWGVVVAPPGYMKSPALSEVMKPLHRLEAEAFKEHEAKMREWSQEMVRASILRAATKSAALKSLKSNLKGKIDIAAGDPDMPVAKRYTVNNFSLEALGEVLLANPDGVLAFSDEIHGLLMMAHKPGNEGLNDFLLSAWNGDGAHTFDRVGRGVRRVERCCVAVLGGIQPGRITEHVIGATSGGAGDSGLLQRFQLLTWPDIREEWELVDRPPNMEARDVASEVFNRLAKKVTPEDVFGNKEEDIRRFDAPAQAAFFAWLTDLEAELRGQDLPLVMASHLSKYRSLVPSLALIFAVADGVAGAVPLQYVEQAIGWANYLRPHAERAYACALRPDTRHARALLDKIKEGAITDTFKLADVYWKGWGQLDRDGAVKAADVLCDLNYLWRDEVRNPSGGRPSVSFHINPKALD